MKTMLEKEFQRKLIQKIKKRFDGAQVFILDPHRLQGVCDLLILYGKNWAMLEVKRSETAPRRPNQTFYVERFNEMSFSAFIFPENAEEVLDAMARSFENR